MELLNAFDGEQCQHVFGYRLRIIAVVGFVAVGVPTQVGCNEGVLIGESLDHWQELAVVLRPPVHAEDDRSFADRYIVQSDAVHGSSFVRKCNHLLAFIGLFRKDDVVPPEAPMPFYEPVTIAILPSIFIVFVLIGLFLVSRLDEREQILVDLVLVRRAHAVRRALVDLQRRVLDDLGREQGRGADRHDLVVVAVQDQRRHVESSSDPR